MAAVAGGDERTVLLLLPDRNLICPLSTAAFAQANNARHMLWSDYRNALILDRGGVLRRFEKIEVLGPLGDSFATKLLCRLTNTWSIKVQLSEPVSCPLDQIKELVIDYINTPEMADIMGIESEEALVQFLASVRAAESLSELFDSLNLPAPVDSLDLL